jgi:acetylornithine deacetylase/succinyl-diaminopimelate desuccinylase-like protein
LANLTKAALSYARDNRSAHLTQLLKFLRIPSIGTLPDYRKETIAAAEWLVKNLRSIGFDNVSLIRTDGNPLVYADWLHAGGDSPTVLIYGHYDVQPADPYELWRYPPFEPTIEDDFVYARGASDDKGQSFIHLKGVESYLGTAGLLPVNVKFLFEGEEESGGQALERFVPENKNLLKADTALISDSHMASRDLPIIISGLRGICYLSLKITGAERDLHSGSFGGVIDNPINVLGHVISKLKDQRGHVLIPGFYDSIRPLNRIEQECLAAYPIDEENLLKEAGAPMLWGEPEYGLSERLGTRPTLDVNGILGGYTGPGAKTVLPGSVSAKLSMRLVPDQDPHEIFELFQLYLHSIVPPTVSVLCEYVHGAPGSVVNLTKPAIRAAISAFESVFARQPIFRREGGTIPVVALFQRHLQLETVLMGFGLPDDNIHSPNERFYLPNFYRGIETAILFLSNLAEFGKGNKIIL